MTENYSLSWSSHLIEIKNSLLRLHQLGQMHDVTIAADGNHINAHKIVLAICSEYFRDLFSANPTHHQHAIIFLKDISHSDLTHIIQFIYTGETSVPAANLNTFMSAAKALKIKGLMGNVIDESKINISSTSTNESVEEVNKSPTVEVAAAVPSATDSQPQAANPVRRRPGPLRARQRPYPKPIQVKIEPTSDEVDSSSYMSGPSPAEQSNIIEPEITIKEDASGMQYDEQTGQLQVVDQNALSTGPVLKYIRTPKGKHYLVQSDHIYWRQNVSTGKTFWKCSMYNKTGCRGRCVTNDNSVIKKSSLHNHPPLTDKVIQSELDGCVFYM